VEVEIGRPRGRPILIPDIILTMKIRPIVVISFLLVVLVLFGISLPAQAAPAPQGVQFATNTPLPDGRIMYQVQPSDTSCVRIALLNQITVEQLMQLNTNINKDCSNLIPGTMLLIGTGGPLGASPTPGPSPTSLPPTITPTPIAGTTEICVLLYNDLNGDALREESEPVIVGGAISVTETSGKYSRTFQTAVNPDPNAYAGTCLTDVPEGTYQIGAALPPDYNPTTQLNSTIEVKDGDTATVGFGGQSKDTGVQTTPSESGGGTSPWLGFLGGLLLLGGLGLGWYALRMRNPRSKLQQSGLLKR